LVRAYRIRLIDLSTMILLCVIILGIIRACQLCLGFDWLRVIIIAFLVSQTGVA
jgi:hypothetical protein